MHRAERKKKRQQLTTSMPIFASRTCGRRPFSCLHSRYHGLSTSRACSAYVMNSIHRVALSRVLFDARLQQKSMFQYPCWFLYTEIYKFWDILWINHPYPGYIKYFHMKMKEKNMSRIIHSLSLKYDRWWQMSVRLTVNNRQFHRHPLLSGQSN